MHRVMVNMKDHDDIRYRHISLWDNITYINVVSLLIWCHSLSGGKTSLDKKIAIKINKSNVSA